MDYKANADFTKYLSLTGTLKVKDSQGTMSGAFNQSHDKYFKYISDGRILCYWSKPPTNYDHKPDYAIFTRNIKQVIPNFRKKPLHWFLDCEYAQDLHLKTDNQTETTTWVASMNFWKNYWEHKPREDWELLDVGSIIDSEVMLVIMTDIEKQFSENYRKDFDYTRVLNLKKIGKSLERISADIIEKRTIFGFIKKSSAQQIEVDLDGGKFLPVK